MSLHAPATVTIFTIALLFGVMSNVGRNRIKYRVQAPATTGHPMFERAYRVQMNTIECALMFLPALWLFAYYVSATWAGIVGGAWVLTRVWYAVAYMIEPKSRGASFTTSMFLIGVLTIGATVGIARQILFS